MNDAFHEFFLPGRRMEGRFDYSPDAPGEPWAMCQECGGQIGYYDEEGQECGICMECREKDDDEDDE